MENSGRQKMKLGVTGGIGSGKTSVCRVFGVLGIPVFSADPEAAIIMNTDPDVINGINDISGRNLYPDGILNKEELASLIFHDPELLKKVNSLVHPVVFDHFRIWADKQTTPYVIMEAAILFESGASKLVDRVATVVAPVEERINRVIIRNRLTREQVTDRIKNQMDEEERIRLSDYVINNSENEMIIPVILGIHEDIMTHLNS
ncbi:MAG TPA: dephospho-CoA kinase [Bacteroidales bacterium]|jgi:dephospho-CoA kinase|nr:dephospho-CoA kinase [Bacteroidales bacterium]HPM87737.1 dephospho-CoA kinase [Bacteroidales bacterium]HQM70605.1 dephospho-CoA kinase [Bacteroidales bacterium]